MVDQQTTIYGHHMNDGSMFNVISDTTDQATFDSIEYVYYITRDATYKLRPLATKVVEDTYAKARTPNFEGDDGLKNYLSEMLDGASAVASDSIDRAASATKVATLVTCRSLSLSKDVYKRQGFEFLWNWSGNWDSEGKLPSYVKLPTTMTFAFKTPSKLDAVEVVNRDGGNGTVQKICLLYTSARVRFLPGSSECL